MLVELQGRGNLHVLRIRYVVHSPIVVHPNKRQRHVQQVIEGVGVHLPQDIKTLPPVRGFVWIYVGFAFLRLTPELP